MIIPGGEDFSALLQKGAVIGSLGKVGGSHICRSIAYFSNWGGEVKERATATLWMDV